MNPFQTGYKFWININVLVKNPLLWNLDLSSFYGITPPPIMDFDLLAENGDALLTEGGDNIQVEHP